MSIVEIFIVLLTVVLLCSWAYLAWTYNHESKVFKRFPPYGVSRCPMHWVLNEDKKCERNEAIYGPARKDEKVSPYNHENPCQSYSEHKADGLLAKENWDGYMVQSDENAFSNEYEKCCVNNVIRDNEQCKSLFSPRPGDEMAFGGRNPPRASSRGITIDR